jgi:chemotaxis protein methyltransferase CheR
MSRVVAFVAPALSLSEANSFTSRLRNDRSGFVRLATMLGDLTGIHLPESEKNLSLMAGRLGPILRERDLESYDAYAGILAHRIPDDLQTFISAMTTNTTEFFRESAHFDHLARLVGGELGGGPELRVWCAACSTGQEVWTILITLHEAFVGARMPTIKLLATDIDHEILARAALGRYTEHEMGSVPPLFRQRYFLQGTGARKVWQVSPLLTQSVTFAPFNLTAGAYPFKHPFDIVFCRNVLIYFDRPTVADVLRKLGGALRPGGHLFLGHSESGTLRDERMSSVAAAVYKRKE